MTTPPPDTKVQSGTLDDVADRIAYKYLDRTAGSAKLKSDILSALRNERERALRDAARLECVFCAGADGFNPLPVEVEAGNYVHRNEPPNGQAGVYCKASRINALKDGDKDA